MLLPVVDHSIDVRMLMVVLVVHVLESVEENAKTCEATPDVKKANH